MSVLIQLAVIQRPLALGEFPVVYRGEGIVHFKHAGIQHVHL